MSVEADLYGVLNAICPRTFPDFAPVSTMRPYVTYQQIGGQVINPIGNDVPNKQNGEFQINVWSNTRAEAAALARQIEAALRQSSAFIARPLSAPASDYDHDMEIYGSRQDFSIWSDRQ
jgi:hypothetical protein